MSKKMIAILLSLVMLLSMAACEDEKDDKKEKNDAKKPSNSIATPVETVPPDAEPTDEEMSMLYECDRIINNLEYYTQNGVFDRSFSSSCEGHQGHAFYGLCYYQQETQWVLSYCYEKLEAMSDVDKWVDSQWVKDENLNVDRQAVLANFTVLQDQFIRTMQKHLDAFGQYLGEDIDYAEIVGSLEYNEDGQIIISRNGDGRTYVHRSDSRYINISYYYFFDGGHSCYTYNEDGTIAQIDIGRFGNNDFELEYRMTPTYDNNGRIATMAVMYADGENSTLEYHYDEQGRLVSVYNLSTEEEWTYTYDANGNLLTETGRGGEYMAYTYDKNNRLVSAESSQNDMKCTYTYDEAGHLALCKGSHTEYSDGNTTFFEITYDYGNYYIYNPAK